VEWKAKLMDEIENTGSVAPEEVVTTELPAEAEAPASDDRAKSEDPAPADDDEAASEEPSDEPAASEEPAAEPMPWGDHPNPMLWLHEQMVAGFRRMHKMYG
jgi:hypothetical protein